MLKDVLLIPESKCPLDAIAELGNKTAKAWLFLHHSCIEKLANTAAYIDDCSGYMEYGWKATEKYPETILRVERTQTVWTRVFYIKADDIAFEHEIQDPKYLFFLKMV